MEVNNKIHTASIDQYCGAFRNCDWHEILTHSRKICLESQHKSLARSNGRIENYNCCRKPGLLRFLRQNPNLTLLGSYHKAKPYQELNGALTMWVVGQLLVVEMAVVKLVVRMLVDEGHDGERDRGEKLHNGNKNQGELIFWWLWPWFSPYSSHLIHLYLYRVEEDCFVFTDGS